VGECSRVVVLLLLLLLVVVVVVVVVVGYDLFWWLLLYYIFLYISIVTIYHSITSYYCLMKYIFVVRRTETRRVKYIYEYAHIIYMDIRIYRIYIYSSFRMIPSKCTYDVHDDAIGIRVWISYYYYYYYCYYYYYYYYYYYLLTTTTLLHTLMIYLQKSHH